MRAICLGESLIDFISKENVPLVEARRFERCLGGAAVNVALGLQAHHIQPALVSRVGKDQLGQVVLKELGKAGLSTQYIQVDPTRPTKCSFISHDVHGHRSIEIANRQSADQNMDPGPMASAFDAGFDALYISGVLLIQEKGWPLAMQAIQWANTAGALIAFDPVFDVSKSSRPIKQRIEDILPYVHILKVNQAEHDALRAALQQADKQPRWILLTKGAQGALVMAGQEHVPIDARPVPCVDPTGAGDAFLAGFLAGLLNHQKENGTHRMYTAKNLHACGTLGAVTASRVIQHVGGNNAYWSDNKASVHRPPGLTEG